MLNRTFKCVCKSCNKTFYSSSNTTLYCDDCLEHKTCHDCGGQTEDLYLKTDHHIHLCNKCSSKYSRVCINTCKICGKEFIATSNRRLYCDDCLKYPKCSECGQTIKGKYITINDNGKYFCSKTCANKYNAKIRRAPGNCIICGKYNNSRDALGQGLECGCSKKHSLEVYKNNQKPGKCSSCGKYSEVRDRLARCPKCTKQWYLKHNNTETMKLAAAKNGNDNLCSHPNFITKNNVKFYKDKEVDQLVTDILSGKEDINNYPGFDIRYDNHICYLGVDIQSGEFLPLRGNFHVINGVKFYKDKEINKLVDDLLSGKEDINNYPGFDIRYGDHVCYFGVDIQNDELLSLQGNFHTVNGTKFYKNKEINQLVDDLLSGKEDINDYYGFDIKLGRVTYNNIDVLTHEKILFESNFQVKDDVKYYKNEPVEKIISKLESGEYDTKDFPGWNKRFGYWCYHTEDILTSDKIILTGSNFQVKDNVEYILDHSTDQYVLKDKFFKQLNDRLKSQDVNSELKKFINLGFTLEPIITIDDSNWNRNQTDRYLSDQGYGWITYIKLFEGKPFIVGKTGTRKVSKSPIDFDFKVYNENDLNDLNYSGQGRRFIREYYPNIKFTDFDKILIKNFDSETEALKYEDYIAKTYHLFES